MAEFLQTPRGCIELPAFFPDATRAAVRAVDAEDLRACGVEGLVVNQFHLRNAPGIGVISQLGGVHAFMGWEGPILSDSGGFQIFSLLREAPSRGTVTRRGFQVRLAPGRPKKGLTPEKAIRNQFALGADVMVCLDHCTHPDADPQQQRTSVDNTVAWAEATKRAFEPLADRCEHRPKLFAVVQGGRDETLRRECAGRLLEIGFDGYGYGGWPVDDQGELVESVQMVAELIPSEHLLWGLGIGKPHHLISAWRMGYRLFDCVLPTRDGRHGRLYIFRQDRPPDVTDRDCHTCLHVLDRKHVRSSGPVDAWCDCPVCRRHSRAYLHHLFRSRDPLALRMATIHNLRFYCKLTAELRKADPAGPAP